MGPGVKFQGVWGDLLPEFFPVDPVICWCLLMCLMSWAGQDEVDEDLDEDGYFIERRLTPTLSRDFDAWMHILWLVSMIAPGILRFGWQVLGFVDSCGKAQWQRWPRSVAYPVCPKGPDDPVIARRLQLLKAGRGTKGFLGHHVPCPCDEANKAKKRQPSTMVLGWVTLWLYTCTESLNDTEILAVLNTISASPLFWEVVHCGIEMVLQHVLSGSIV